MSTQALAEATARQVLLRDPAIQLRTAATVSSLVWDESGSSVQGAQRLPDLQAGKAA